MRAICRVPGERMFNTRGLPEAPRVFTSAANTAAITRGTSRIIPGITVYVVSEPTSGERGGGRRGEKAHRGGGIVEYALVLVRVAILRGRRGGRTIRTRARR